MKRILAAAFIAFLPLASGAADAPAPVQDWSKDIETVVVTPNQHGPLLWHIHKDNADVYILGIVAPVPEKLPWNSDGVRAALKGAKQLILPARASVGLFEGVWFMLWNRDAIYLPDGTPMESTLPNDLRQRFVAARTALHQDADRYSGYRVPLAGLRLEGDFLKAHNLSFQHPTEDVRHIASQLGVSYRAAASYEAIPLLKQLPKMSASANNACMKAALDDIEAQGVHAADAADAWATGDLEGMKANYSEARFESCVQSMPSFAALFQRAVGDSVGAVNGALARPGKTVMIMSVGALLRQNGVLDRLRAEGLTVDLPSN
jgi:uncharacterized protein YbaP (TraB family)